MRQKEREVEALRELTYFNTTQKSDYVPQSHTENTIGRRVMKTQDGKGVSFMDKDEQLLVEQGIWRRQQKASDDDLWLRVPKGEYGQ